MQQALGVFVTAKHVFTSKLLAFRYYVNRYLIELLLMKEKE